MKKIFVLFIVCFFCTIGASAQIKVDAQVGRDTIAIGEQFALYITLEKPEGQEVDWPRLLGNVGDFEITQFTPISSNTENGVTTESQTIHLTTFNEGYFTIPGLRFMYRQGNSRRSMQTKGAMVAVGSVAIDTAQAFKPIKPVEAVQVPFMDYFWYYLNKYKWLIIAIVFGLLLLGGFLYWWNSRKEPEYVEPPTPIPAHETALRKLKELESEKLWQEGKVKPYYVELTEILREYVENRFDIPALESTTDEIMDGLGKSPVNPTLSEKLRVLLNEADLVKFAKARPEESMHKQKMKDAMVFVQHTKNIQTEPVEASDA